MGTRLLMYSQDGLGLGHLRRAHNIAREVLALEPQSSILIVADSPATSFFSALHGVDYLKLPTIVKRDAQRWSAETLHLKTEELVSLRASIIKETFWEFRPDAVLVDHMPLGALGELKSMLDSAVGKRRRPFLFLGLRDVLGQPEVIRRAWHELGGYEYLSHYDAVLIYGCRELYDAESAYRLTPSAQGVRYCHYVAPEPEGERAPVPHQGDVPLILVMVGGGHDGFPLARAFVDALPILLRTTDLQALILTGPNIPAAQREALVSRSVPYPVDVRCEDATPWLQAASVVVTMAGYNSLCEVLKWRKRALVVPRPGPSAEQRIRSQLFSQRRLVRVVDPADLTAERLAEELVRLLADDDMPQPANIPPLDGARQATKLLLGRSAFAGTEVTAAS
ncbi:MAG: hypothetical protein HYS14_07385 [Candidatus Rokubacteria bacterium]|nr:hypothetical protein [Candidatus Rokubacteria bacterium]